MKGLLASFRCYGSCFHGTFHKHETKYPFVLIVHELHPRQQRHIDMTTDLTLLLIPKKLCRESLIGGSQFGMYHGRKNTAIAMTSQSTG
jgi:hypothetical protein